ncbi:hypothetical protein D3C71_2035940 [compost metagenome]
MAVINTFLLSLSSTDLKILSLSVPNISARSKSLPSPSTFIGSSIDISVLVLLFFLKYINISFSIHLEAYVASLIFLSKL